MIGCASIDYQNLKPVSIYTLEDGSKIKVYWTPRENIYVSDNNLSIIK